MFFGQPDRTIILIAQDLSHWPVAELAASANEAAGGYGFRLVTVDFRRSGERERALLQEIEKEDLAGVIFLWDHAPDNLDHYHDLTRRHICIQVVDPKSIRGLDFVGVDEHRGGHLAAQHLLGLGYRQIGHVTLQTELSGVRDRGRAFRDAIWTAGLTIRPEWSLELPYGFSSDDRASRTQLIRAFLAQETLPKALFACADWVANEVIECAYDLDVAIPGELAIIGYDDSLPYSQTGLPLTTVRIDRRQIGRLAVEQVMRRRQGPVSAMATQLLLPPVLVVRESTVGMHSPTDRWEAALVHIHDNYRNGVSAQDVASVVGLEPHYFSHRFRAVFGRRFTQYVQELRLRSATELLETTDRTVEEIAEQSGFRSLNHFYTLFRRSHQLTPHAYRRLQSKSGGTANFSA